MNDIDLVQEELEKIMCQIDDAFDAYMAENDMSFDETLTSEAFLEKLAEHMHSINEDADMSIMSEDERMEIVGEYLSALQESKSKTQESCGKKESDEKDDKEDDDKSDEKDTEDESDEKDTEDESDEKDDEDGDETDENEVSRRHTISKTQSMINRREYAHNMVAKRKKQIYHNLGYGTGEKYKAGGRLLGKKIKKALNVQHKGKKWESTNEADGENETVAKDKKDKQCDCGKKDCPICNPKEQKKESCDCGKKDCPVCNPKSESCEKTYKEDCMDALQKTINVEMDVIKESIADSLGKITTLGELNEDDSNSLKETISNVIIEQITSRSMKMAEQLAESSETYILESVLPVIESEADKFIEEDVIPEINDNLDKYMDYVANEFADRLFKENMVVKSRKSEMLESFMEKLIDLIETETQIIPEQEDAVIALEDEVKDLHEMLDNVRRDKSKTQFSLNEAIKRIFVLESMPTTLSENQKEQIEKQISEIKEADFDAYKERVLGLMKIEHKEVTKEPVVESVNKEPTIEEKRKEIYSNIVNQTLKLL